MEITRLENSNVRLNLTVPRDEVRSQYQDLLKDYVKKAQIPGFRKGKVPLEVLERKFGEALKNEALDQILESAVTGIFKEERLPREDWPLPYSSPVVQDKPRLDFEQDLSFSVVYDVFPKVNLGQWKGLEVEVPVASVTEEDLNRELEVVRERNAIVLDRDDGAAAQTGDVVTVNYCEIGENGEVLVDSEREDFVFTLGSGYNIYQFDDEITGMKKGETREFSKTFPADFEDTDLAGQSKKIQVTLTALKEKKLPDLDDDLAQDVDEQFSTLGDLKNSIGERLNKNLETRLTELKVNGLMEKLIETTPIILPESMIREEVEGRLQNTAERLNIDTKVIMRMLSTAGKDTVDGARQKWYSAAERSLRSRLIMETLIKEQKLEVNDEEVTKHLETMAAESGATLEEVKKYYQEDDEKESLTQELKERKFFDVLLAENTIRPGKEMNYLDLMRNNE
jgi:trigger factor